MHDEDEVNCSVMRVKLRREIAALLNEAGMPLTYLPCSNNKKHVVSKEALDRLVMSEMLFACPDCTGEFATKTRSLRFAASLLPFARDIIPPEVDSEDEWVDTDDEDIDDEEPVEHHEVHPHHE